MSLMHHLGSMESCRQKGTESALSEFSALIQKQSVSGTFSFFLFLIWVDCQRVQRSHFCYDLCAISLEVNVVQACVKACVPPANLGVICHCYLDFSVVVRIIKRSIWTLYISLIVYALSNLLLSTVAFPCRPGVVIISRATQAPSIVTLLTLVTGKFLQSHQ